MKKIKKNLKWITLGIVVVMVISVVLVKWSLSSNEVESIIVDELSLEEEDEENLNEEEEKDILPTNVYVDIKGAIKNPGVYEIEEGKKVIDVVQLAGGFTDKADTSMVNLAKKVANEMVIIIYTVDEVKRAQATDTIVKIVDKQCVCPQISNDACLNQGDSSESSDNDTMNGKININNATVEDLMNLSGVGESKAKAIIQYREENGNFEKVEDIMDVPGIGEALYEKIKANITV